MHYLPNVDLPNHLLAARYFAGQLDSSYGFLQENRVLSPFLLFSLAVALFSKWVGFIAAAKIVISLYVLMLPAAFWFLLGEFKAYPRFAFLLPPMAFSYHFEWGFIQYCIGVPVTVFAIAFSFRVMVRGLSMSRNTNLDRRKGTLPESHTTKTSGSSSTK